MIEVENISISESRTVRDPGLEAHIDCDCE